MTAPLDTNQHMIYPDVARSPCDSQKLLPRLETKST